MTFRPEAYRILVVDDDSGMRLAMAETLKRKRYQVDQAEDGETGLSMVAKHSYQALITDLRMPGMTGLELLSEVKKVSPATEVLLVTAYGTIPTAVEAMKYGAYDFIQKPFSAKDLEKIVYNALVKNMPENAYKARDEGEDRYRIVTRSEKMLQLLEMAKRAAKSNATVLIQAESGTGKELLARFICRHSERGKKPVIAINCAALPDNLLESELFGYEKGSFTGALHAKPGKFELADGGTILLDEIGEMPLSLQAKLLRVLQEQEVDRIGGKQPIHVDVRVIAMTNRDLKKRIEEGNFREDLYYRLNVIPMEIASLRERKEDLDELVGFFMKKFGRTEARLSVAARNILMRYHWPGNVRELENMIQRALILSPNDVLEIGDLFQFQGDDVPRVETSAPAVDGGEASGDGSERGGYRIHAGMSVAEAERILIELTLGETQNNKTHAAKMLGISLRTLRNKLNEYAASGNPVNISKG
ncbi:Sigma-54-dependent Fis family transcriptional regulator [Sulfidibacter corallicola]|uniref:Sigma-54-dependent Fis family transcriptional regulator n=1 Tax=Sulfidibacter corallicola TaxID=2818388 RepID=A0A8A4TDG5_SULCO|nr:sigma-54 dependent transcriptional regulator [Sulfidibacter corallicola]QTD47966.1 sigma-54-dependent Fis family transcriptional regulator [Sulfidibacter corallicola]